MLTRSLRYLCLCLAASITIFIDQSGCHQRFSRRGTLSFSASGRHRFARHTTPRFNNRLPPRSNPSDEDPSLAKSDAQAVSHRRRSIDLEQFDDNYTSQSLDQERDQAEKLWEEFMQLVDGEDADWYADGDDDVQSTSGSHSVFPTPTSTNEMSNPATSSGLQGQKTLKTNQGGSNHNENHSKSHDENNKTKEIPQQKVGQLTTQAKQVDSESEQAFEAKKKQEATEAKKAQEAAEAKKNQEATEAKKAQEAAEAKKKQEATEVKKAQEAAEAKKEQEIEAKKEQEAEYKKQREAEAKQQQEAEVKKEQEASKAKKDQDGENKKVEHGNEEYQVTDLKKIPGTAVTTGTAHPVKDEKYNSAPSSEVHTGDATFFTPDVGACGIKNEPGDYIVAVSHLLYDSFPSQGDNPNTSTICNRMVRATYNGKSVDVKITDRCQACDSYSLDFTESAFQQLAPKEQGRLHGMTWTFI